MLVNVSVYSVSKAVATSRHGEAILPRYMTGEENNIGVKTHELAFSDLVVEIQCLLKLQSGKISKIPRLVKLNALVRCHVVESPKCDKCVRRPGTAWTRWGSFSAPQTP